MRAREQALVRKCEEAQKKRQQSSGDEEFVVAILVVIDHIAMQRPMFRGSILGHAPALNRNKESGLVCKEDDLEKVGFCSYHKCIAPIWMLAYGIPVDLIDEYVCMSEFTCSESMYTFCKNVVAVFGLEYLREPNATDTARLLGQYRGHVKAYTIILGVVVSQDLWIWHFFGMTDSHNDTNVLQRFLVFGRLAEGNCPDVNIEINGYHYNKGYYLADGIYRQWTTFVKTILNPIGEKRQRFAQAQESARKDVERDFGVLQSRWGIFQYPIRT
ncbi:uncharacterized protein [Aegilops tauschii subsp. strangulata]|uniref:uncharacterized protein n=1 Tax=Aegilops tauschii subsp. strangulata TaxID=200361 RepID=UPI00098BC2CF|nr:uncharacterized protein LOC109750471 [Aegilops tauschii subsp. strangulata]